MLGKIEGRRRKGRLRMRWLDGISDSMDMSLSKLGDKEGQGRLLCCSPWGRKESDTTATEQQHWLLGQPQFLQQLNYEQCQFHFSQRQALLSRVTTATPVPTGLVTPSHGSQSLLLLASKSSLPEISSEIPLPSGSKKSKFLKVLQEPAPGTLSNLISSSSFHTLSPLSLATLNVSPVLFVPL